jgi:hypothetical protein
MDCELPQVSESIISLLICIGNVNVSVSRGIRGILTRRGVSAHRGGID